MKSIEKLASFFIIAAGICWGMIGYFSKHLSAGGYSSVEITFLRCIITALFLWLYMLLCKREALKIALRDIWMFVGTGILSIVFFNIMYFMSIQYSSLSMAAILLYTAPCIVMVLSVLFFHEQLTIRKVAALVVALTGCLFTSGIVSGIVSGNGLGDISLLGIGFGLASGLGYALYTIFGNAALKKYDSFTVTAYTFLIAALALAPFCIRKSLVTIAVSQQLIWDIMGIGLGSTLVPFLLYTLGLRYTEPSKASVMAFVEPMVATLVGVLVFHERMTLYSLSGVILIFISICLLNFKRKKN